MLTNRSRDLLPPLILGALILQAAYGAVDLLVVGKFGSTAGLSAVSTGSQVLNLVTFVVIQLAMGITVLIARYIGEKKTASIGSVCRCWQQKESKACHVYRNWCRCGFWLYSVFDCNVQR